MIQKFYALVLFMTLSVTAMMGQNKFTVTDADLVADSTYLWKTGDTVILDGFVFLEEGGILNIEPGVVVKGKIVPENGIGLTGALIITRGAQIFAEGTADNPIIFTAEVDPLDGSLTATDNLLWGGLIVLGKAPIGEDVDVNVGFPQTGIEGIESTETRAIYGGTEPEDNSGVLKYISIRHGGAILAADNEINGLTLGGVGSKTQIDYIEVFANKDDGIEIFGGTVSPKHLIAAFIGDDGLDFDESWNGFIQFAMTITYDDAVLGEHSVEYDGSEDNSNTQPRTTGRIYNGTFIGAGASATNTDSRGLRLRDQGQAQFWNCIWTEYADYVFRWDATARELTLANNMVFGYGGDLDNQNRGITGFTEEDPKLGGISRDPNGGLDPRLDMGSPALVGAAVPGTNEDGTLIKPPFRGAFGNEVNWADGWTALADKGYFGDLVTPEPTPIITIKDTDIEAGGTLVLDADNEYLLDGNVFVEEGATIVIPAGTVIRGKAVPSTGDISSALIIARGGRIEATGTAAKPIIFTAELDDLNSTTDLTATDNQLWGGVIILGKAPIGSNIDAGVGFPQTGIEGVPSTELRALYGGTDPEDDSGIFTYVSIRHGGSILASDNEINGLTIGGVGSKTIMHHIEVFANKDDGIEIFGGTLNLSHVIAAFVGDDGLDFDQSWNGFIQFAMTITYDGAILGEHAVEYDGSEDTGNTEPRTTGRIYNGTFIGGGASGSNTDSRGLRLRNEGQAQFWNCIWTEFTDYVFRWDENARDLVLANNIVFNYGGALDRNNRGITGFTEEDPGLLSISWDPDGGLDPRIDSSSPAASGASFPDGDPVVTEVTYRGAFNPLPESGQGLWLAADAGNTTGGWTALAAYGYLPNALSTNTVEVGSNAAGVAVSMYPSPAYNGIVNIDFELPIASEVAIQVMDMSGRALSTQRLGVQTAGKNLVTLDVSNFKTGAFIVAVHTEMGIVTRRFTVMNQN